jgi:signal transduction histidine kinase
MSHEIRTPISGVLGMAEILAAELHEAEQREYIENIQRSATSLLTVINDILDFSKVESGRLDIEEIRFSLPDLAADWSKWLRVEASLKDLEFEMDFMGELENDLTVIGDPGRIRQILNNLGTNSLKFTNEGQIKFSIRKESETDDTIEIRFTVEDTGIGIDDEIQKRLFQPFSQGDPSTARKFGGTGLGLTICRNLLDLMKGRIALRPATGGGGTVATFWVPFTKPKGPDAGLVPIDALPDRLQCEMSVSCNSSEFEQGIGTPPLSDGTFDKGKSPRRQKSVSAQSVNEDELPGPERAKILVLVVEDK